MISQTTFSQREQSQIAALGFRYEGHNPHSWETMPFYKRYLRGFLAKHPRKAIWIKGGIVKREAYLVFYSFLGDTIVRMMSQPLADLGSYQVAAVKNPMGLLEESLKQRRVFIGLLELPQGHQIGYPLLKWVPVVEDGREGWECAFCGADFYDQSWLYGPHSHDKVCPRSEYASDLKDEWKLID